MCRTLCCGVLGIMSSGSMKTLKSFCSGHTSNHRGNKVQFYNHMLYQDKKSPHTGTGPLALCRCNGYLIDLAKCRMMDFNKNISALRILTSKNVNAFQDHWLTLPAFVNERNVSVSVGQRALILIWIHKTKICVIVSLVRVWSVNVDRRSQIDIRTIHHMRNCEHLSQYGATGRNLPQILLRRWAHEWPI